jgi:hypothetical protein
MVIVVNHKCSEFGHCNLRVEDDVGRGNDVGMLLETMMGSGRGGVVVCEGSGNRAMNESR